MAKKGFRMSKYQKAYLKKQLREKGLFGNWYERVKFYISREKYRMRKPRDYHRIISENKKTMNKKTKSSKHKKTQPSFLKKGVLGILITGMFFAGGLLVWFNSLDIPSVENFESRKISNSTKIYDKTGEVLLYDIHENIRRTAVEYDQINQHAKNAIIAIEDHSFYTHNGVVLRSTARAIIQTLMSKIGLREGGIVGGSTLTQQVVKNTLLTTERSVTRKVKEWVLAYKIEQRLSKDEILEIYLNEAPYGGTIYGIEEASNLFFGIPASELSIAQSAYLASIPNLPTYFSPYGPNKDRLDERQRVVLREMKRYGYINDAEYREALEEEVEFLPENTHHSKALHFVQFVRAQLEEEFGVDVVENGGLRVITTLDYKLQQEAETIIREHIEEVQDLYDAHNAGLVAIEVETGQILTMVGSRDYFDTDEFDGNFNVALAKRQPGSSFKPIAYATAFEKGYLPETAIFDTQTQFNSSCDPDDLTSEDDCWAPNNYDFQFKGPVSLRNALAQSRNIPAVKVLHLAGIRNVLDKAQEMGISSLTRSPNYYGLGLVLGGGEVSLLEMVGAYTVFANDGRFNQPVGILEVIDADGETLKEYQSNEKRVLDSNAARMISSILGDNEARTPLFGPQSFLYFGSRVDVAGKTGTTNDNRDAWLIGYTSDVAVGVWTGNNDNSPMKKGSTISGKPWRKYMEIAMEEYRNRDFRDYSKPENTGGYPAMVLGNWKGGEVIRLDSVSGKRATEFTPEEAIVETVVIDPHTILHWINKNDPTVLDTSRNDAQYENWEYSVLEYVKENFPDLIDYENDIPDEYDDVHTGEQAFGFNIDNLKDEPYQQGEYIEIELDFRGVRERDIKQVQYFVNNSFVGSKESEPFRFRFRPEDLPYQQDINTLRVIVTDEDLNKVSKDTVFGVVGSENASNNTQIESQDGETVEAT
jgi:penicillin-binding protein 1C